MRANLEKIENREASLLIEADPSELEEARNKVLREIAPRIQIPGFRRGKAPPGLVERYVGRERILREAADELIPKLCREALEKEGLKAIGPPSVEIKSFEPLKFQAVVPLEPLVELGDWKSIRIPPPEPVEIPQEEVDKQIEDFRRLHAEWRAVDREARMGDLAILDVEGTCEGEVIVSHREEEIYLSPEDPYPVPGFAKEIVGMRKGEERSFEIRIPENFERTELAGKLCSFKVKLLELKEEILPDLDEDFIKRASLKLLGEEASSLEELREKLARVLRERSEEKLRDELEERVLEELVRISKVEYPPYLLEMETRRLLRERLSRLSEMGVEPESFFTAINKTPQEYEEELRAEAERILLRSLLLSRLCEEEKIEVSDEEVEEEARRVEEEGGSPPDKESLRDQLLFRKAVELLIRTATSRKEVRGDDLQE